MTTSLSAKEREHRCWTDSAPGWRNYDARLRSAFAPVTERMLQAARVNPDDRVLDIACGTGEPTLAAAEQVGPAGYVLGTDFVEEMLVFAREKAARRRLDNVDFRRVDGEELEVAPGSFDAVLVRWGLCFMQAPLACLQRAQQALRTGGRIAVACWAGHERNPAFALADGASDLAFADPEHLRGALREAGFVDVAIDQVEVKFGGEHVDASAFLLFLREIAPSMARLYAQLPPADVAAALERYRVGARLVVPAVTWVAHGRA